MDIISYVIIVGLIGSLAVIISVSWWYIRRLSKESTSHRQYTEEQKILQREMQLKAKQKFEKVVAENADFIEKDVRTTAAALSGRIEKELTHTVEDELNHYKAASKQIEAALQNTLKELQDTAYGEQKSLLADIRTRQEKMSQELEAQHREVAQRVEALVSAEVTRRVERFEESMATIVQEYVLSAVKNQLDVDAEFEYIMRELEANKAALREDISNGAA